MTITLEQMSCKGNLNPLGARSVHQIISMSKWIRTSRLSKDNAPSGKQVAGPSGVSVTIALERLSLTVPKVFLQKLTPPQIRHLILHYH